MNRNNFEVKYKQIDISLKLDKPFDIKSDLELQPVTNEIEAKLWVKLFKKSFG